MAVPNPGKEVEFIDDRGDVQFSYTSIRQACTDLGIHNRSKVNNMLRKSGSFPILALGGTLRYAEVKVDNRLKGVQSIDLTCEPSTVVSTFGTGVAAPDRSGIFVAVFLDAGRFVAVPSRLVTSSLERSVEDVVERMEARGWELCQVFVLSSMLLNNSKPVLRKMVKKLCSVVVEFFPEVVSIQTRTKRPVFMKRGSVRHRAETLSEAGRLIKSEFGILDINSRKIGELLDDGDGSFRHEGLSVEDLIKDKYLKLKDSRTKIELGEIRRITSSDLRRLNGAQEIVERARLGEGPRKNTLTRAEVRKRVRPEPKSDPKPAVIKPTAIKPKPVVTKPESKPEPVVTKPVAAKSKSTSTDVMDLTVAMALSEMNSDELNQLKDKWGKLKFVEQMVEMRMVLKDAGL